MISFWMTAYHPACPSPHDAIGLHSLRCSRAEPACVSQQARAGLQPLRDPLLPRRQEHLPRPPGPPTPTPVFAVCDNDRHSEETPFDIPGSVVAVEAGRVRHNQTHMSCSPSPASLSDTELHSSAPPTVRWFSFTIRKLRAMISGKVVKTARKGSDLRRPWGALVTGVKVAGLARCLSLNCDPSPDFIGLMGFVCGASKMHQATHWLGPEPGLSG